MPNKVDKHPPPPPNSPDNSQGLTTSSEASPVRSDERINTLVQGVLLGEDNPQIAFESSLRNYCEAKRGKSEYGERLQIAEKMRIAFETRAKSLDLSGFEKVTDIIIPPGLNITSLSLRGCKRLRTASFSTYTNLEFLSCHGCEKLKRLLLNDFTKLQYADFFGCTHLKTLNIAQSVNLRYLTLSFCDELPPPNLVFHPKLQDLDLSDYHTLASIDLSPCQELEAVNLSRCTGLNFIQLGIHPNLVDFNMRECRYIVDLPDAMLSLPESCTIHLNNTPLPVVTLERINESIKRRVKRKLPVPTFSPPLPPSEPPIEFYDNHDFPSS